jgi:geranylgeranyl pyrophosphate synthase
MTAEDRWPAAALLRKIDSSPLAKELRQELHSAHQAGRYTVEDMARYCLLAPGKLAVEYLHVASLTHDDVIDGAELRRGQQSVQSRHGVPAALVTGDFLMMRTFAVLADGVPGVPADAVLGAIRVLAAAGEDLCRGQIMESELTLEPLCSYADYEAVIALKTGALFSAACRAGAILGQAAPDSVGALSRYGAHCGLAFQMYDDLLPYITREGRSGKSRTDDLAKRRPTFAVLVGTEFANSRDRAKIIAALSGRMPVDEAYDLMRSALENSGALHQGRMIAESEISLAKEELRNLPNRAGTELLAAISDVAFNREQ